MEPGTKDTPSVVHSWQLLSPVEPTAMLSKEKTNPTPKACVPCRERHLKCDGHVPLCNRCVATGSTCTWVQSRRGRGRRGPSAKLSTAKQTHNTVTPLQPSLQPSNSMDFSTLTSLGLSHGTEQRVSQQPQQQQVAQRQMDAQSEDTISMPYIDKGAPDDSYLISLYYRYIHPAHPFLLPYKIYQQDPGVFPDHLKRAMYFIASHHHASAGSDQHYTASNAVFGPDVPNDTFKVQSLILLTLASYARFERDRGNKALNAAINVAHDIGLNSESFAWDHEPLFRESWRRTWWELYTITGLISLISGTNMQLTQPIDMTLPHDCEAYESCQTPHTGKVREIQERFRAELDTRWSSFAFKVEAMRILNMVREVGKDTSSSKRLAAEAAVSSWLLSLPEEKQDGLTVDGQVDEVMSCALMIIHLAGICLHLPQSPLALVGDFKTVCGNEINQTISDAPKVHQAGALRSAKALARLLSTHPSLSTLSPCFSCAVAYSAVVLLAEYSAQKIPKPLYLGETLQLELSALRSLGQTWPIAGVVRGQIAAFARDIMGITSESSYTEIPDLGASALDDQWLQDLIGGDAILPD